MNRFYGFDLGDAESAIARLDKKEQTVPDILPVQDAKSFVTAYALVPGGEMRIGEGACLAADAIKRQLRFKSRFLRDTSSHGDVRMFASGVLGELYQSGDLIKNEDCCFYVGCPAGWDKNAREDYRAIFEKAGYPPVRIVSESRAALVTACQSKHLQVGYDILSRPVLVVDIGSSTTDFAYICGGKEVEMRTAGEVSLGGGIMDEILLDSCVSSSSRAEEIRQTFAESEAWRTYCEFAARRLKERYYNDPDYFANNPCVTSIRIVYDRPLTLTLTMNKEMAERLEEKPWEPLGNKSFKQVFLQSLRDVRDHITGDQPELVFLTGGVSRLPSIKEWCRLVFPEAVLITGTEPEFAVARGLAWSGRIDEELREFKEDLEKLKSSRTVEDIVEKHLSLLYRKAVDALVEPILEKAAEPVFEQWRAGKIRRFTDTEAEMQKEIGVFLKSEEARKLLVRPITEFLKPVADDLEEFTVPICLRHHVPYKALSLNSFLSLSELNISIDAKNVFAVDELTWLIDSVISVLVGILCGGSGMALIANGPVGILAGTIISLTVLLLGKDPMEKALLKADVPVIMRQLVPRDSFSRRRKSIADTVRGKMYESLRQDKEEELTNRMTDEISLQIEQCLTKMAEVVEIPLG